MLAEVLTLGLGLATVAGAVLYASHAAYEARLAREAAARHDPPGPDPALDLPVLRQQTVDSLRETRETLARVEAAFRQGIRG